MAAFSEKHRSMDFLDGSKVFLVEGKLFKIPEAILSLHTGDFFTRDEFVNRGSVDTAIHLNDSSADFEAFWEVLLMPLESCIFAANPSLAQVLGVFTTAHKYFATGIESRARAIATSLTRPDVIRQHITPELSAIRIVEIATLLPCEDVTTSAWNVVMEDFKAGKVQTYEILVLAERTMNSRFLGEAYYNIMLLGYFAWSQDPNLTATQMTNLSIGTVRCVEAWDAVAKQWGSGNPGIEHACTHDNKCAIQYLSDILLMHARRQLSSSDVVARLECAMELPPRANVPRTPEDNLFDLPPADDYVNVTPPSTSHAPIPLGCREAFMSFAEKRRFAVLVRLSDLFTSSHLSPFRTGNPPPPSSEPTEPPSPRAGSVRSDRTSLSSHHSPASYTG